MRLLKSGDTLTFVSQQPGPNDFNSIPREATKFEHHTLMGHGSGMGVGLEATDHTLFWEARNPKCSARHSSPFVVSRTARDPRIGAIHFSSLHFSNIAAPSAPEM